MLPTIWYEMKWARATSQSINGPLDRTMVGKVSLILTYFRHSLHLLLPFSLWPPFSFLPWQVSFKVATLGESLIKFSQNCLCCNNKVEKLQNYCKFLGSLLICLTNSAVTVRWENLYFPANPS